MKQKIVSKSSAAESDTTTTLMLKKLQKVDFDALCLWVSETIQNSGYAWIVFDFSKLPVAAQKYPVKLTAQYRDIFFAELNKRFCKLERPLLAADYDSPSDISGYKDSGTECFVGFAPTKYLFRVDQETIVPKQKPKPEKVWPVSTAHESGLRIQNYCKVKNIWDKNPTKETLWALVSAYVELSQYRKMTPEHIYKYCTQNNFDSLPPLKAKKLKIFIKSLYKK